MKQKKTHIAYFLKDNLVIENNSHFQSLNYLYNSVWGKIIRLVLRSKVVAKIVGLYKNSRISTRQIQPFINQHSIDMNDFFIPEQGFKTFNEFFIRSLKPGARPIDPLANIIAPADSKVYVIPDITKQPFFFIKKIRFELSEFLGSHDLARQFENGILYIFRLAPYDYHRFHFPVNCIPSEATIIHGTLESVNPLTFHAGKQPLLTNERHCIMLDSLIGKPIAMVAVGAMMVGKITHTFKAYKTYNKGDEAGYFSFGGSTIVLLFKKDTLTPNKLWVSRSNNGFETAVKNGNLFRITNKLSI